MKSIKIILVSVIPLVISFQTVYAKWAYAFVVYNKNVYIVTDKKVDTELIGPILGHVTKYSTREGTYWGNFSNEYPRGTKYYEIIGSDVNKVIAVKEKDGTFTEAQYAHEYRGAAVSRYGMQVFILYSVGFILLIIVVILLTRRKIQKAR